MTDDSSKINNGSVHKELPKPILIYDGDCNFCCRWVEHWRLATGNAVQYEPYQKVAGHFPNIKIKEFQASVQYIDEQGKKNSGALAVFKTLSHSRYKAWLLWSYEHVVGFKPVSEAFYGFVAKHRGFCSQVTRFLWGNTLKPSTFIISRRIFLAALGIIYTIAFSSLAVQIVGLSGSEGVVPVKNYLTAMTPMLKLARFYFIPTIFWINSSDFILQAVCWIGVLLGILIALDLFTLPALFLAWFFYLSYVSVCRYFLWYQWDVLLLETGFLAIFFVPLYFGFKNQNKQLPKLILFLFWWLLFRLIFSSGMVKLISGDPAWANLTALQYHYETQPLPNVISWDMAQLPFWFQKLSVVFVFFVELIVPFLIFMPRRIRHFAAIMITFLQVLIMVTGNYAFFNWLIIALCVLLIDDDVWMRIFKFKTVVCSEKQEQVRQWSTRFLVIFSIIIFLVSIKYVTALFPKTKPFKISRFADVVLSPFNIVNAYGLFANMTTTRPEIVIEGSKDREHWKEYEFKFKPGNPFREPKFCAPFQPRLDWQMWFAAQSKHEDELWFENLMARLLHGSKPVARLLKKNFDAQNPPVYIRALLYDYQFTDGNTRAQTGQWWQRKLLGAYFPTIALSEKVPEKRNKKQS